MERNARDKRSRSKTGGFHKADLGNALKEFENILDRDRYRQHFFSNKDFSSKVVVPPPTEFTVSGSLVPPPDHGTASPLAKVLAARERADNYLRRSLSSYRWSLPKLDRSATLPESEHLPISHTTVPTISLTSVSPPHAASTSHVSFATPSRPLSARTRSHPLPPPCTLR
eukprot:TRINITY_DN30067_c0_g1_i1.p1 TRINITY_DN30067_c0_g1~~TRINITY_DN30067_c0_g1_i1.p1  ORF type:complete len:170 (+),score=4.14 TRINITY_DN30067_c0_g1_i1:60-569(+)